MNNGDVTGGPMVKVNVFHGRSQYEVFVPAQSTFGDVKNVIWHQTGLKPKDQRLFFRGKENDDDEQILVAGLRNNSNIMLLVDSPTQTMEKKNLEEVSDTRENSKASEPVSSGVTQEVEMLAEKVSTMEVPFSEVSSNMSKALEAIVRVRAEVDHLAERVSVLEVVVGSGSEVDEKEFVVSTELLMRQLLSLDGIEAEGEAKMQRKAEVRRVQKLVDSLDSLKSRNSNPVKNSNNVVSVTTQWETFDSGVGSLNPPAETTQWETFDSGVGSLNPPPPTGSSTRVTQDWEQFD